MTDETKQHEDAVETPKSAGELGEEFKRFGQQLGDTVTAAWESDEGRNIRNQIGDALKEMAQQLDSATKKIASHEETQKLRSQAEQLVSSKKLSRASRETSKTLVKVTCVSMADPDGASVSTAGKTRNAAGSFRSACAKPTASSSASKIECFITFMRSSLPPSSDRGRR